MRALKRNYFSAIKKVRIQIDFPKSCVLYIDSDTLRFMKDL